MIPEALKNKLGEAGTEGLKGIIETSLSQSAYEDFSGFKTLMLRRVEVVEDGVEFIPELFVICDHEVFYYDKASKTLELIANSYQGLFEKLEKFYRKNQSVLTGYADEIEMLEGQLFERNIPPYIMDMWFDIKTDLARVENFYFRNQIVFFEFFKKNETEFGDQVDSFIDIKDMIAFQNSNLQSMKSRLDSLHHYYKSIKDERLNKTLFTLTIVSAVFLPLHLIVGFFGINTPGLYFTDHPQGTDKVVLILLGVLLVTLLGFKVIRLTDRFLLRFFLGRYDVYRNLIQKVNKLDKNLTGR